MPRRGSRGDSHAVVIVAPAIFVGSSIVREAGTPTVVTLSIADLCTDIEKLGEKRKVKGLFQERDA